MLKIGDRVAPFDNMSITGTVIDMYRQKSDQWMVGGAMEALFIIKVKLDKDESEVEFRADRLMRVS
jgi:hypothetical protein